jgi:multiple sugar transport system substrate-binding protein
MARIDRRRLLQLSGGGAVAAGTGGIAAILASGRAPAFAQGTSIHWLKFVDFVPVSDQLLKGKLSAECQKALGIKLEIETINGDGVRRASLRRFNRVRVQHPDGGQPGTVAADSVDVSDVAEEIGQVQGVYFMKALAVANDGKKWIAVPYTIL